MLSTVVLPLPEAPRIASVADCLLIRCSMCATAIPYHPFFAHSPGFDAHDPRADCLHSLHVFTLLIESGRRRIASLPQPSRAAAIPTRSISRIPMSSLAAPTKASTPQPTSRAMKRRSRQNLVDCGFAKRCRRQRSARSFSMLRKAATTKKAQRHPQKQARNGAGECLAGLCYHRSDGLHDGSTRGAPAAGQPGWQDAGALRRLLGGRLQQSGEAARCVLRTAG